MTSRGSDSSLTVGLLQGCICLNSPRSQAGGFVQLPGSSATLLLPRSYIKPKKKPKKQLTNPPHRNCMPTPPAGCVRCQPGGHLQGRAQKWAGAWAGGAEVMRNGPKVQQDCTEKGLMCIRATGNRLRSLHLISPDEKQCITQHC